MGTGSHHGGQGLAQRGCIACGSSRIQLILPRLNGTSAKRCRECGLRFVDPLPSAEEIRHFYHKWTAIDPASVPERFHLGQVAMRYRLKATRRFVKRPLGRILDVGCGPGFSLYGAAQLGLEAYGLDLDLSAVEVGRAWGLNILHGRIEEVTFPEGFFDVVLCSQLIEHVINPPTLLATLHRLVAPGGMLIVETPNAESPEHLHRRLFLDALPRLQQEHPELSTLRRLTLAAIRPWRDLDPPRHLYCFTPRGLKGLLERCGFQPVRTDHYLFRRSLYFPVTVHERRMLEEEERKAAARLRARSLLAFLGYRGLWVPAMELLRAYCWVAKRGIGLAVYALRESVVSHAN